MVVVSRNLSWNPSAPSLDINGAAIDIADHKHLSLQLYQKSAIVHCQNFWTDYLALERHPEDVRFVNVLAGNLLSYGRFYCSCWESFGYKIDSSKLQERTLSPFEWRGGTRLGPKFNTENFLRGVICIDGSAVLKVVGADDLIGPC